MNNLILPSASGATMTSQQIADLVGSRHDSVKRSIERLGIQRKLKGNPVIQLPPLVEVKNHLGQTVEEYVFSGEQGERDSYVVVAQLSPQFTAKLVDEWRKLKGSISIPQTYAEALLEAGRLALINEEQAKQIEAQKPAVEFVQKYVEADNLKGFREVCKLLNANERDFRQFLVEQKIVYRLGGAWTAYKPHIEAGRMDTKAATANGKTFNQIMFTAKGVAWIAEKWGRFNGVESAIIKKPLGAVNPN